jgi:hypothetical protein
LETATLPGGVDHRGGHEGEAARPEVYWSASNRSPELHLRTVGSGRGRSRRSEMQTRTRVCQGDAQGREKGSKAEKKGRGGRRLPTSSSGSCSTYGSASSNAGSLVAVWLGFWEETIAGAEGVFVDARERQNRNQIRRINHEEIALSRASLSDGG